MYFRVISTSKSTVSLGKTRVLLDPQRVVVEQRQHFLQQLFLGAFVVDVFVHAETEQPQDFGP